MPEQLATSNYPPREGSSGADVKILATLLHLQRRARNATGLSELDYMLVNESFNLVPYRQAVLWLQNGGVQALSGMAMPEGNAPYVHWINQVIRQSTGHNTASAKVLKPEQLTQTVRDQWGEWLPSNVLLQPLRSVGHFKGGYLLLARDKPWRSAEISILSEWAQAWSHARALFEPRNWLQSVYQAVRGAGDTDNKPASRFGIRSRLQYRLRQPLFWILVVVVGLSFVPVRLTVLAPAELIPRDPNVIRAPLDGVVEHILVQPNQYVEQGEPLLSLERSAITNRLLVAQGVLNTLRAEHRQRAQQALTDPSHAVELAVLEGQMREKELEIAYLNDLLTRGEVLSPISGVVFLDDPMEWSGRPVVTGQRILVVAEEQAVQLEAWLALGDAIALESGSRVRLFLNADPLKPVEAELEYVSFQAQERPDGHYAYRVRAQLLDETAPGVRVGLKGTAKLEGERIAMAYWMLRRPLAALRGWLGI